MPKDADDDGSGEVTFDEFCMLFGLPSASGEPLPAAGAASAGAPAAGSAAAPPRPPPTVDRVPTRAEKEENARLAKKHKVSEGEIQSLRESFWTFDADASGSIDCGELGQAMAALGVSASEAKLQEMIAQVDEDGGGSVEFEEFCALFHQQKELDPAQEAEKMFNLFDTDRSGFLSHSELANAIWKVNPKATNAEIKGLLRVCDPDDTGQVRLRGCFAGIGAYFLY